MTDYSLLLLNMLGGPTPALAALPKKQEHRQHTGCPVPPCWAETLGTAEGGVENEGEGFGKQPGGEGQKGHCAGGLWAPSHSLVLTACLG